MTSAYLQQLGRREFQPTGTSGTHQDNYASIDPGLEEAANKNIDENTEGLRQTFRALGEYYNEIHDRRKNLPNEILRFTKQGFELKQNVEALNKFNKEMNAFEATLTTGGLAIAETEDVRLTRTTTTDPQVQNFENAEYQTEVNKKDRVDLTALTPDSDIKRQLGPDNPHDIRKRFQNKTAGDVVRNFPVFFEENKNILLIDLKEMGIDKRVIFSQLEGEAQRKFGYGKLTNYYLAAHENIVGSNRGKYKRDVVLPILNQRNQWLYSAALEDAKAIDTANIKDRKDDLILGIRTKGPGHFIDHINIHKGAHRNSYIITRKEAAETVAQIAQAGGFNRGEIEEIIHEPFFAHDGSQQTIAKYWPKQAQTMLNGVVAHETAQYEFEENNRKAQSEGVAFNQVELLRQKGRKGEVTIEDVNNSVTAWSAQTGRPRSEAPAILKDFRYSGISDDASLDQIYTNTLANGGTLSESDIMALKDPDLKIKYRNEMARRGGIGDDRKSFLTKATDTHFQNKLGEDGRDLDWYFTNEAVKNRYAEKYEEVLDKTGSPAQAKAAAQGAALDLLQQDVDGTKDLTQRKLEPIDENFISNVSRAQIALAKDPNLLNSSNPWKGEEVHLKMAAEYLKSGGKSPKPYYYWKFTGGVNMAPELLLRHRLRSVGAMKENEYQLPEEVHLTVKEQRSIKNGSPSSVYKLTQKKKDINWMLREVQDDVAVDGEDGQPGKGYDHIRNSNGDIVELIKPLSQHTVGEVADLINQGYTDFGMYGITNDGLRSIMLESPITLDTPFDQNLQDLLILARLRQKAQQAQKYSTINDQYRRLVNINPNDEQQFLNIVGDLPPYLQLSNLLPAVAKEMVDQTLQ